MRCFLPVCFSSSTTYISRTIKIIKERTVKAMSGKHSCSFGKKYICYFKNFNELNFKYKALCNVLTNNIAYLQGIFHQGAKARILKTNSGQNSSKYIFFFQNGNHKTTNWNHFYHLYIQKNPIITYTNFISSWRRTVWLSNLREWDYNPKGKFWQNNFFRVKQL